ncbi:MAG: hypothetical protein U9R68_07735 [Planctomycetota bacterium]|nr:hypothetical protein [Planctomycetota bacterium]
MLAAGAAAGANTGSGAEEPLVNNLWVETDLRQVLQDISAETGTAIIADHTVLGPVSLAAKNMPLEDCLERVCASGGYHFVRVKDYYLVGRAEPGTEVFRRLAAPERVELRHASAEQVETLLPSALRRYVTYEKVNGVVLVTAPEAMRGRIRNTIKLIDTVPSQVAVEAIVFELTEDGSKQLGLDWEYTNRSMSVTAENLVGTVTYTEGSNLDVYLALTLRAIVQEGEGRILANPRIIAMDGQEAEIFIGQQKYFSLLSGQASNPYYRLESIEAGVTLKVTPHIGDNGQIVLDLSPEVADVVKDWDRDPAANGQGNHDSSLPVVTRRKASTSVAIGDGQTVIIGGLLQEHDRKMVEKGPLLGDVPLIGAAFQKVRHSSEQKEVVIMIRTELVRGDAEQGAGRAAACLQRCYVSPLDAVGDAECAETP